MSPTQRNGDTPGPRPRGPVRRWAGRLAFVLIQGLLLLVVLEIAGRVLDPLGISYYPETARFLDTMILEEPIGYRNRPELDDTYHGARYSLNSLGLRSPEIPETPPPGERRILFLGDSVIFGFGVENDETIPAQLERLADERAADGTRFRVVNMGVASYNTEQESIQLASLGPALHPDAVVLLYTYNDVEPKMWVFEKRRSALADLAQRSYAACLLFTAKRKLQGALGERARGVDPGSYSAGSPRWRIVDRSLTAISAWCRERGIPFVLLVRNSVDEGPYVLHRAVAEREGFPIVPVAPVDVPPWDEVDWRQYENSPTDSHFNPAGCRMFAEETYRALQPHGFFDGGTTSNGISARPTASPDSSTDTSTR